MQFGPQKSETNNFELFLMEWPAKKQFQKTRAEGMQFYCPSRTYAAIPYSTIFRALCDSTSQHYSIDQTVDALQKKNII